MFFLEGFLLFCRRRGLVLGFPVRVGLAIDYFPRLFIIHVNSFILCRRPVPLTQAISAEACKVHQINVLHIFVLIQMLHQSPECGSLKLGFGYWVHAELLS